MIITIGFFYNALKEYLEKDGLTLEAKLLAIKNFHHTIELNKFRIVDNKVKDITERMETITRNVAIDTFQKNADNLLKIIPPLNDPKNPIKKLYNNGVDDLVRDLKKVENFGQIKQRVEEGLKTKINDKLLEHPKNLNIDTYLTWRHEREVLDNVSRLNHEIAYQKDARVLVSNSVSSSHEICGTFIGQVFNAREMTDDQKPQYHPNCKCYLINIPPEADEKAYKDAAVPKIRGGLGIEYVEQRDRLRLCERNYWNFKNTGNEDLAKKWLNESKQITDSMNNKILQHKDFRNLAEPQTTRMFLKSRIKQANQPWFYDLTKK